MPPKPEYETPGGAEEQTPAAVLLVDDDPRNLLALESVLDDADYTLIKARTGDEALLALMAHDLAAIVLDVQMPDVNGIELARLIKRRKRTQHIPIIFLTAHYREDEHAVLGYDAGAVDYLTKPIHPAVLRSKVNVFVDLFRKTRALAALNRTMQAEISERRTAEERFRVVVEAAPSAMIVFDDSGAIRLVNSQTEQIFGYTRDELLQRRIGDLFPSGEVPRATDANGRAGHRGAIETTARRRDEADFPVEVDCRPIQSSEGHLSLASVLDVTERRQAEEAEAANAAKDRFLAMLSHELRTPLSPILHAVTLLEKDDDCPQRVREAIAIIRRNVRLEARLIDDLLDLARIRTGKLALQVQPVDAHEVLHDAMAICFNGASHRKIRLIERFEASNTQLAADPARLQQIFWNLLANAAKFTPEGGAITVRTVNPRGEDALIVEINDTGIGIEPQKLDRIFDAFEQAPRNASAGLGLGLAICKALVDMHGGTIEASSSGPNCGASFVVKLLCSAPAGAKKAVAVDEPPKLTMLRVLLAEDHYDTAEMLRLLLAAQGYEVRTASSVAQAIEVAEEYEFDILVSDIGLPDGRGTDLLSRLQESAGRPIRAIAMSGFGMEDDLERSRLAGFAEHLIKPIELSTLQQAITRLASAESKPAAIH